VDIKRKITKNNSPHGCVEVVWWDADTGRQIGPINVSVLDDNGQCPQGDALQVLIDKRTPLAEFQRQEKVAALGEGAMAHIEVEVGVERTVDLSVLVVVPPTPTPQEQPIEPSIHNMEVL
jgi:hypothetical protein